MKRSYLLFIAVLLCGSAFAQSGSRVVSFQEFNTDTTGTPRIFGNYVYSNGNGGVMLKGRTEPCMNCDYPIVVNQPFDDISIHPASIFCDTAWQYNVTDSARNIYTYSGYNITGILQQNSFFPGVWSNVNLSSCIYDIDNNLTRQTNQNWVSGAWQNLSRDTVTYSLDNQLLSDISLRWDTSYWENSFKSLYTYDGVGNLVQEEYKTWDNATGNWLNDNKRVYYYTSGVLDSDVLYVATHAPSDTTYYENDINRYHFSPSGDTESLVLIDGAGSIFTSENIYDASHNTIERIELNLNAFEEPISSNKWDFHYNSFNQIDREIFYNMDSSGNWVFAGMNKFYYELYTPASTAQISPANNTIAVYPSPTKNLITVKLEWNESKPFSIGIYDMSGRMVKQWTENAANSFAKTLPIPGLAAGNYIIKATNGAEEQTGRFVVGN